MKLDFKKLLPHLIAIGIFLIVALVYCKPALEGLSIEQHDTIQWKGMAKDPEDFKAVHGHYPSWTKSMFGGMPTYNIAFHSNAYVPYLIDRVISFGLPQPINYFFLACICFYFLAQVMRINPWISILAALGFAYCSYDPIIISVGHHTKMISMALMPALLAGVLLIYEKKYWIGGALTALFTGALVVHNHLQIVYYTIIIIFFITVVYAIRWIKQKDFKTLITAGLVAAVMAGLGALSCAVQLFTTKDYAKESMRGGRADLGDDKTSTTAKNGGLDIDYAFAWSYGIPETFTLLVPNVNGGISRGLGEESKFYETLVGKVQSRELDQQLAQQVGQMGSEYWGPQTLGTSGPVYLGAIICLLCILGAIIADNKHKWWIIISCVLAIMMAWGSNFMAFNKFLFEYLPMYKNFRVPTLTLVIPQLLFPLLGALGLQQLLFGSLTEEQKLKAVKLTGIVTGVIVAFIGIYYFSATFMSPRDAEIIKNVQQDNPSLARTIKDVLAAAAEDRQGLFKADLIRTLFLLVVGLGILFAFTKKMLKPVATIIALMIVSTGDLLAVGTRYLNEEKYAEATDVEPQESVMVSNAPMYKALKSIEADKDPHYRVLNNAMGSVYDDALTSAFVRSIGGYHPAKISIYEDLRDNITRKFNMNVLNMLDTRYVIVPTEQGPQVQTNPDAFGPAWLVKNIRFVPDAKTEMASLDSNDLKETAFVQESFKADIKELPQYDSSAFIKLKTYDNELITYDIHAPAPQFAVLSEVYYASGWNAYADGNKIPIVKTDYALRGVAIPKGTKELKLTFEPESHKKGFAISAAMNYILVLLVIAGLAIEVIRNRKKSDVKISK